MSRVRVAAACLLLLVPAYSAGEPVERSRPLGWVVARSVAIDPTTYAPWIISYEATMFDWRTSQVLFAHGWVETNPRFTVSGLANDRPVDYATGKRLIREASVTVLGYSILNNAAVGLGEGLLVRRFPERKKLIRILSWAERIGYASIVTYMNSADHVRQARTNKRLARKYGQSWLR